MTVVSLRTRKRTHKRSLNLDREQYNPGAPGLALPIEQVLANPPCGFHPFDIPLALHGGRACRMDFAPNQNPRPILDRVLSLLGNRVIVFRDSARQILGLADVETSSLVLEDVYPVFFVIFTQAPRLGLEPRT